MSEQIQQSNEPAQGCQAVDGFRAQVNEKPTLLMVGDSPTLSSGFARVVQNLARRWMPHFQRIDFWGIGYNGWPASGEWSASRIYPAGWPFQTTARFEELCGLVAKGKYTHVWMIQDLFNLSMNRFPEMFGEALNQAHAKTGRRTFVALYYPVDAPLEQSWLDIMRVVDLPVAYTRYGREQTGIARIGMPGQQQFIDIIPHGVDTSIYRPLPNRAELRSKIFAGKWAKDDWLLINVSSNQRRKGLPQTFKVVSRLKAEGVPVKLYMHMAPENKSEGIDLRVVAGQYGLVEGEDWRHGGAYFKGGSSAHSMVSEATLNELYNACDLFLTTTLGEGWGLPITEALAAGLPCFVPDNTSCREIALWMESLGCRDVVRLEASRTGIVNMQDNSRVRYPVDAPFAAKQIKTWLERRLGCGKRFDHSWLSPARLPEAARKELDWDGIAERWLAKLGVR